MSFACYQYVTRCRGKRRDVPYGTGIRIYMYRYGNTLYIYTVQIPLRCGTFTDRGQLDNFWEVWFVGNTARVSLAGHRPAARRAAAGAALLDELGGRPSAWRSLNQLTSSEVRTPSPALKYSRSCAVLSQRQSGDVHKLACVLALAQGGASRRSVMIAGGGGSD